jgi:hypothetical protein
LQRNATSTMGGARIESVRLDCALDPSIEGRLVRASTRGLLALAALLADEEVYVAKKRNRVPRSRAELARLINASVLREAVGR